MESNTALIARHLLDVHSGDNWTGVNITDTLQDVTAREAATVTAASANTIEALLNHITFWNRVMTARINGQQPAIPPQNGFDTAPALTEPEWAAAKAANLASARALAAAIATVAEGRLDLPILPNYSTVYKNLQGTVEHVHYHLGQIMLLKHLVRAGTAAQQPG